MIVADRDRVLGRVLALRLAAYDRRRVLGIGDLHVLADRLQHSRTSLQRAFRLKRSVTRRPSRRLIAQDSQNTQIR